jgi:hypothetical protein
MIQRQASNGGRRHPDSRQGANLVKDVITPAGYCGKLQVSVANYTSTTEQTHVIKQITKDMENTKLQTENISRAIKEQNKGSQLIIESTERIKDISYQVKTSTAEQRSGSKQIAGVIENVTQQASQIANATAQQKEKSLDIVQSVELIRSTTNNLTGSAHSMNACHFLEEAMVFWRTGEIQGLVVWPRAHSRGNSWFTLS